MTNKEAIRRILDHKRVHSLDEPRAVLINEALDLAIQALENERLHGEWIIDGHHIRCSRCNEYICNTDRESNKIPDNFCPNCGADMRKGSAE